MLTETLHEILIKREERGLEKGLKRGLKRGKLEGIKEGKAQTAIQLLKEGLDTEFIAKVTGLSKKEIDRLKAKL